MVIVRADKKAITPRHIEALFAYCRTILLPLFDETRKEAQVERKEERVLSSITEKCFEAFFLEFKREKEVNDPTWLRNSLLIIRELRLNECRIRMG